MEKVVTMSKEMGESHRGKKTTKRNQMEISKLKSIIYEMKSSPSGLLSNRMEIPEERFSEPEKGSVDTDPLRNTKVGKAECGTISGNQAFACMVIPSQKNNR